MEWVKEIIIITTNNIDINEWNREDNEIMWQYKLAF